MTGLTGLSDTATEDSVARISLRRDGVTGSGYLVLATWGWFLYGFGALLPELGREQGTSATVTSLHSVLLACGGVAAGALLVPLVRRFRRRGVIRLAVVMVVIGVVGFAAGGSFTVATLLAVLVAGTGGALMVSAANPLLDDHHGPHGPGHGAAALAEGNALAAGCGLLAPLLVGLGLALGLSWRPAVLVTVPLAVAAWWLVSRQPAGVLALDRQSAPRGGPARPMPRPFLPLMGMLVALVGVEFCMAAWSAELLHTRSGMSNDTAAAGVSAVVGGMMIGRLLTGRVALRYPPRPLLLIAIGVCAAGWAVAWTATSPVPALLGLLLTGIGMGSHYPLGASLALGAAGDQRDLASGRVSIGVGIAAGGGPFAIGAISDATSTHAAFLVVPVLLVAGLVLLLVGSARPAK